MVPSEAPVPGKGVENRGAVCLLPTRVSRWSLRQRQPVPASSLSRRGPGSLCQPVQAWIWLLLTSLGSCLPSNLCTVFVAYRILSLGCQEALKAVLEGIHVWVGGEEALFLLKIGPGPCSSSLGPSSACFLEGFCCRTPHENGLSPVVLSG
jgi:hypothetical protein